MAPGNTPHEIEDALSRFGRLIVLPLPLDLLEGQRSRPVALELRQRVVHSYAVAIGGGRAVVVIPEALCSALGLEPGLPVSARVSLSPTRRPQRIPNDLARALELGKLALETMLPHERHQALLLIAESHNPAVRAERIAAVLRALLQRQ